MQNLVFGGEIPGLRDLNFIPQSTESAPLYFLFILENTCWKEARLSVKIEWEEWVMRRRRSRRKPRWPKTYC